MYIIGCIGIFLFCFKSYLISICLSQCHYNPKMWVKVLDINLVAYIHTALALQKANIIPTLFSVNIPFSLDSKLHTHPVVLKLKFHPRMHNLN
jgi:uncharacterized protein with PQ loop repeat